MRNTLQIDVIAVVNAHRNPTCWVVRESRASGYAALTRPTGDFNHRDTEARSKRVKYSVSPCLCGLSFSRPRPLPRIHALHGTCTSLCNGRSRASMRFTAPAHPCAMAAPTNRIHEREQNHCRLRLHQLLQGLQLTIDFDWQHGFIGTDIEKPQIGFVFGVTQLRERMLRKAQHAFS